MHPELTHIESIQAPVPEGDPDMPDEGQRGDDAPRTEPGNPEPDGDRIERSEEDLERVGK